MKKVVVVLSLTVLMRGDQARYFNFSQNCKR